MNNRFRQINRSSASVRFLSRVIRSIDEIIAIIAMER